MSCSQISKAYPGLPQLTEAVAHRCSVKKVFLEISKKFTGKQLCQNLFFNKNSGLIYPNIKNIGYESYQKIYGFLIFSGSIER